MSREPTANRKQPRLPLACKVIYLLFAICLLLYLFFTINAQFADQFNAHVSLWGRRLLSYLTVWIPFSLAECLLLSLPILLAALIVIAVKRYSHSWRAAGVYIGKLAAVLCSIGILFVLCFAPGYYGTTLDKKLGLERRAVSAAELTATATWLAEELATVSQDLTFTSASSSSVMPFSFEEMNDKLMDAYAHYTETQGYPDHFYSRAKRVMLSEAMSYTHITGVYSFFTGEANVNVNFPDYTIPFTAAHELAHQRGVAREDEANMVAFLVCLESDDAYIRYSGLLNVYEYVASALRSADRSAYNRLWSDLDDNVKQEERAYSAFFEKYRENTAANVSQSVNNAYLQSQGSKEGTKSYNMVVDLTVAYYLARIAQP